MRIAQVAPLHEAVPPSRYGGTERVVHWLTEELVRRGHEVTLFASGDSTTRARLVPVVPRALRLADVLDPVGPHVLEIAMLRDRRREFDVIHSHIDYLPFPMHRPGDPPLLTTLHGRLDNPQLASIYGWFREQPLVSISDAQRAPLPDLRWLATVHHGLPLEQYPVGAGLGDYFLFLGRLSPEKRPHVAIDAARRAGVRLVIAAKLDNVDRAYFEEHVAPRLGVPGIEYVGETTVAETIALLGDARALLFPILWPEPFGLAMIESLACGTPVITRRCGSIPEIITDGEVGFICDDDEELASAIRRVAHLDRAACRRRVETEFSVRHMAEGYERVYARLVAEHAVTTRVPRLSLVHRTEQRATASEPS